MRRLLKNEGIQAFVASIICILLGILIGYIVLLFINPAGAGDSILNVVKNFFYKKPARQMKELGRNMTVHADDELISRLKDRFGDSNIKVK